MNLGDEMLIVMYLPSRLKALPFLFVWTSVIQQLFVCVCVPVGGWVGGYWRHTFFYQKAGWLNAFWPAPEQEPALHKGIDDFRNFRVYRKPEQMPLSSNRNTLPLPLLRWECPSIDLRKNHRSNSGFWVVSSVSKTWNYVGVAEGCRYDIALFAQASMRSDGLTPHSCI